ncbi:splicing factor U2AF protein [Cardiosporidium cionae]|uniref:Splicing factor U2AF protein n=1 Tax=Cardiosporidium cionae TaxID=476202 RepID=A0ABQ7J790_9APIC|nr:splicing factor U2AF protein [Cardiosporidium cionae]|eukprot:KAF8819841.1 splicing factor U2AF protein [Cardiosporidium cionae]
MVKSSRRGPSEESLLGDDNSDHSRSIERKSSYKDNNVREYGAEKSKDSRLLERDAEKSRDKDRTKERDYGWGHEKSRDRGRDRGSDRTRHRDVERERHREHERDRDRYRGRDRERAKESEHDEYKSRKRERCEDNVKKWDYSEGERSKERARRLDERATLKEDARVRVDVESGRSRHGLNDTTDRPVTEKNQNSRTRSSDRDGNLGKESEWDRNKSRNVKKSGESSWRRVWRFDSPPKTVLEEAMLPLSSGNFLVPSSLSTSIGQSGFSNAVPGLTPGMSRAGEAAVLAGVTSVSEVSNPNQPNLANLAAAIGLDANATKAARELYVGNLPPGVDVNQLLEFLNAAMSALKATTMPGNSCTKAWISTDGHYAFVEFRTMEEASNGMQLNGLNCLGYSLRIGRPKTYPAELAALAPQPTAVALDSSYLAQGIAGVQSGVEAAAGLAGSATSTSTALAAAQKAANVVSASLLFGNLSKSLIQPDRMCIMGLPAQLSEDKVKALVTTFGSVKFFQLLTKEDGTSSGVCICDFQDYESQQQAIEILTKNTPYIVMKASDAVAQGLLAGFVQLQIQSGDQLLKPQVATRVIMLCNLVTKEELLDEKEYEDILEDVRLECTRYGVVLSLEIPRPMRGFTENEVDQTDVGYAFVEFSNTDGSAKARKALSGRKFSSRIVEAHYFSEIKYLEKDFKTPSPNYEKSHSSLYNATIAPSSQIEVNSQSEETKSDPSTHTVDAPAMEEPAPISVGC